MSVVPLVLLPGLICDARIFRAQVDAFPGAIALPGYGLANELVAMARLVLDQAPPRFALLGHSMGARVALEVVRVAPERVERLALVSTGTHGVRPGEADKRYALRDLGRDKGMVALVEAWLPPMISPENQRNEALVAPLREMCIEAGLDTYEAQIEALLSRPEVESLLPGISCPTLVATGSEDIWSPPAQHMDIANTLPNAQLRLIEGAGHMLPAENPQALNDAISQWLSHPL
jgi:pimeloyl-ACP methyl ester carboxylesterase